jgi:hypothetical protein
MRNVCYYFFVCCVTLVISCQKTADQEQVNSGSPPKNIPSVCIWDNAWVLTMPSYKSSKFTTLSLGEKVSWQGITVTDSANNNREFLRIILQDSTEGWVRSTNIVTNAVPAAITDTVCLYERPDLVTIKEETLDPMDIIAVVREQHNWLEIMGNRGESKGWIQNKNLTYNNVDLAVALQYSRIKHIKNGQEMKEKIYEIIENIAFENSLFMIKLRRIVVDIVRKEQDLERQKSPLDSLSEMNQ